MIIMHPFYVLLSGLLASMVKGLPEQKTSIDPNDPNKADPTSLPTNFVFSGFESPDPFPSGIPTLPAGCHATNMTQECLEITKTKGRGARLYFADNHGWRGAEEMLFTASRWSGDQARIDDDIAADYWLGPDYNDYTVRAQGNIKRASGFLNNEKYWDHGIVLSCSDPLNMCNKKPKGDKGRKGLLVGGYAWDEQDHWWSEWSGFINMCAPYFLTRGIYEIVDHLNELREKKDVEALQDMRSYRGSAQFMIHEMMHLRSTWYPEPKITDMVLPNSLEVKAYGPRRDYLLAHRGKGHGGFGEYGAAKTTTNADSYAMFVNTVFWWKQTGYFPGYKNRTTEDPDSAPEIIFPHVAMDDGTDLSIESLQDKVSKAIDSYSADDDVSDQPSNSEDVGKSDSTTGGDKPVELPADVNSCHGISGDWWVMSRDVAAENVKDFCSQSEQSKRYNADSVNELELSVKSPKGEGSPKDSPDCVGRFLGAVIDGCDGGDPLNNPYNYKFGSTMAAGDGWSYTMTPWSQQVNEVNCDVSYKFFYEGFQIRGKNWPDAKFGIDGAGLREELSGCGALTKWKFEWTPDDCCFQWYASGHLPIGTKSCVGRAIESAGGSGKGHCKKRMRNRVRSDNISNWPGYGDEGLHVFGLTTSSKRDNIDSWPGYGDESKHVFQNDIASA